MINPMLTDWVTMKEAAELCRVSERTIRRWVEAGLIKNDDMRELPTGKLVFRVTGLFKVPATKRKRKRRSKLD
jgi:predicted site-specific integrase-resolvase